MAIKHPDVLILPWQAKHINLMQTFVRCWWARSGPQAVSQGKPETSNLCWKRSLENAFLKFLALCKHYASHTFHAQNQAARSELKTEFKMAVVALYWCNSPWHACPSAREEDSHPLLHPDPHCFLLRLYSGFWTFGKLNFMGNDENQKLQWTIICFIPYHVTVLQCSGLHCCVKRRKDSEEL